MNRYFILIAIFIMLSTASFAQKTINTFIEKYGQIKNVELYDALKMMSSQVNDTLPPEKKAIIKKLKTFQVMNIQFDESNKNTITDEIVKLKANLLKDKYEELASFKSNGSKSIAMVFIPENKAEKDYVQIVEQDDTAYIIHIAGEMTDNEFSKLIASISISENADN
ncbi:hypothetical protein A9P82_12505 [Arachidicoccus ginsenosidimutans]|uniref:DUF4252 domain-containing protein n=1 Tax=Arachidicoccus sp. BS20 TaxID=1850526 RepID=UPI0007F10FE0|nr:DUF4252 domain-containing protein [Arachidicoccus sp. BS20]ANI90030.1 hypothetical protein A9P82_12505 [Arachidicoccus sp. BS20]